MKVGHVAGIGPSELLDEQPKPVKSRLHRPSQCAQTISINLVCALDMHESSIQVGALLSLLPAWAPLLSTTTPDRSFVKSAQ